MKPEVYIVGNNNDEDEILSVLQLFSNKSLRVSSRIRIKYIYIKIKEIKKK